VASIRKARGWKRRDGTIVPVQGWEVRYRDLWGRQRSQTVRTMAEARALKSMIEVEQRRGTWVDPDSGRAMFAEVAEVWLESNPGKRATTLARDRIVLATHFLPLLGRIRVGDLRPSHIRACVDAMTARGLAPKTIHTNYSVVRAVLTWAVEEDIIGRTPCRGIRLPEVLKTSKRVATASEIRRLADELPDDYRVMVFLGSLGLRLAEVVGLRVGSIDFLRRTLAVQATLNEVEGRFVAGGGKTKSAVRTISLPGYAVDELAAHLARTGRNDPADLVLAAPGGGPLRASNFRTRFYDPAVLRAGLDGLTFHRLRHSAGALMRELGVPLEVIQRRLGHASIRTTADVYGNLPESIDRAVADQLDSLLGGNECGTDVGGKASEGSQAGSERGSDLRWR
jgi:integrase